MPQRSAAPKGQPASGARVSPLTCLVREAHDEADTVSGQDAIERPIALEERRDTFGGAPDCIGVGVQ